MGFAHVLKTSEASKKAWLTRHRNIEGGKGGTSSKPIKTNDLKKPSAHEAVLAKALEDLKPAFDKALKKPNKTLAAEYNKQFDRHSDAYVKAGGTAKDFAKHVSTAFAQDAKAAGAIIGQEPYKAKKDEAEGLAHVFKDSAASTKAWATRGRNAQTPKPDADMLRKNMESTSKHTRTAAAFLLKQHHKDTLTDYDKTRIEEVRREGLPQYYGTKKEEVVVSDTLGFGGVLR